ncbi:MAG: nucleotidyltransferase substrate binding protein [Chitinophagaceae bacterium]
MTQDIRWEQRFSNFNKALAKLAQSVAYIKQNQEENNAAITGGDVLQEMVREGLIQRFEYTHELAWNVMKDFARYQGNSEIAGSRDATREAFQLGLISDGAVWMDMIGSRNRTSHTYNQATADEIYHKIVTDYFPAFSAFQQTMEAKKSGEQTQLW